MLLVAGPAAAQDAGITVEPSTDLVDGDTLTVTVTGFPASSETFVSGQCVTPIEDPLQQCNVANIIPVALDANGEATFEITVNTGPIGTGNCGFGADDCVIMVGSLAEPENAAAPISFADEVTAEPVLAETGTAATLALLAIAMLLVAAGMAIVGWSRKLEEHRA
jgi:hypothetical protein